MAKLPLIRAVKLIRALEKIGFKIVRQEGSHVFLRHSDGRTTVVPNHPGEKLDRGLLNKIIKKDVRISRDEFLDLIK